MIPPIAHKGKPLRVGSEQIGTAAGRGCGKVGRPPAGRSKVVDGFTVGAEETQMTPSGQRQAPVDFLSDVGLRVVAMRKAAFTILGALLIVGSAVQIATASEHHMRTGRGHHQSGRAYNNAAPQALDSYGKPAANVTQGGGHSDHQ